MKITLRPTLKQTQAWEKLFDNQTKYIFFGGGAGGGKSWQGCEWLLQNCYRYPGTKWFIGREELKRLMGSTYVTWTKVCNFHKIPTGDWKINGQYNFIEFTNGSRIDLLDVKYAPIDPLYERFGSTEYTGGWLEEAGEINYLAFDVLKSRIGRHMNKELNLLPKMFITCNPKKNWLYYEIYQKHKNGSLPQEYYFIQSLFGDNPHTADSYKEQLNDIKDLAMKERLMFGNWEYDDDPATLIDYSAMVDLWTNAVPNNNKKYLTADIARYGQDKTVIYLWNDLQLTRKWEYTKQGLDESVRILKQLAFEESIPYSQIIADEDGVGGGVIDNMRGIKGFVGGSIPMMNQSTYKPDNYQNLRTQCYYKLAEEINNHRISIQIQDVQFKAQLIQELEQVKSRDADSDAKRKLISKEDVKDLIGRSPDYADALMMRMWYELKPIQAGQTAIQYRPSNLRR